MISEKIKKEIIDFADGYGAIITFKDELQVSHKDISLKWSDGKTSYFTVIVDPVVINDNNTIQVSTRIVSTKSLNGIVN